MPGTSYNQKEAAVIVPVFRRDDNKTGILFIHRSEKGVHGGQLGFPGGRCEDYDTSPLETALRETREEIGVDKSQLDILERLAVIDTRTTGFRIHPFLARMTLPQRWHLQEEEVSEVILATLDDITNPENHGIESACLAGWSEPREIPFIRIGDQKLWGVSYRILKPLLPHLLNRRWDI